MPLFIVLLQVYINMQFCLVGEVHISQNKNKNFIAASDMKPRIGKL